MEQKKIYLGTNTKMYKNITQTVEYLERLGTLTADVSRQTVELFVIPSFTTLQAANPVAQRYGITLGAQNMCWEDEGQFTGEISPLMLQEVGVRIVELGHSERRHVLGETDGMIRRKVACARRHGFTTLLCIGETQEEKARGASEQVLRTQLEIGLAELETPQNLWIAYEPVWAIGVNGRPASATYAAQMHAAIRRILREKFGASAEEIPLLYGGSVCRENACELICQPDIDGLFIGRSAWNAEAFQQIIEDVLRQTGRK